MNKNEGALSVETFRWFAREEFGLDYSPYSADFKIVIDADEILDTSTMFAGTDESEQLYYQAWRMEQLTQVMVGQRSI